MQYKVSILATAIIVANGDIRPGFVLNQRAMAREAKEDKEDKEGMYRKYNSKHRHHQQVKDY